MLAGLVGLVGPLGLAACGGGPSASVGVTVVDDTVEVRAKSCHPGGMERVTVVDPVTPDEPVWTAEADGPARLAVPVAAEVDGYVVTDRRPDDALPDARLRVLVEGPDGEAWGGPRFRPEELTEGTLRVAGQDVDLAEWEAEEARCPSVGLGGAVVAGLATAVAAAALWFVVRLVGRALRRSDPEQIVPR